MRALLIIDMQEAFTLEGWGSRNNPQAEERAQELLNAFRERKEPVIHVQHVSDNPTSRFHVSQGQAFLPGFEPKDGEAIFQKQVNSAFIGTDLEPYLREQGIDQLVIVGLTLPHCVSTTTRMAANLGFAMTLISDATASFSLPSLDGESLAPELIHQINLVSLKDEFAQILTSQSFLEE